MTKHPAFNTFSIAYRIILGLITILFIIRCLSSHDPKEYDYHKDLWFVPYSILTITVLTIFQRLGKENNYREFLWFTACILVLASLAFSGYFAILVFKSGDGNLLINAGLLVSIILSGGLFVSLIRDKRPVRQ